MAGPVVPWAELLAGAVDDYVVRLGVPGGVVHDCTAAQARGLAAVLVEVAEAAERAAVRDRRAAR